MKIIVNIIGVFVLTAILYAIPILTACSFIYEWNGRFQLVLIVVSIIEFGGLATLITDDISRGE
jgi:hypothetical protein